jgi:hypothetical protein
MKKGKIENETSSEEEDEEDDSEAKSEESDTPSEKMRFEEEFKKFLRTPEGIAAVLVSEYIKQFSSVFIISLLSTSKRD